VTEDDLRHLRRCVELATLALEVGDEPFGSVLVSGDGEVLFEDHNHALTIDATQHPEFAIARWAGQNLPPAERARATVYTSAEHCAMCSAAHAWVGLGRIVIASSRAQWQAWAAELGGGEPSPIRSLSIRDVIVDADVEGPVEELAAQIRELHRRHVSGRSPSPRS